MSGFDQSYYNWFYCWRDDKREWNVFCLFCPLSKKKKSKPLVHVSLVTDLSNFLLICFGCAIQDWLSFNGFFSLHAHFLRCLWSDYQRNSCLMQAFSQSPLTSLPFLRNTPAFKRIIWNKGNVVVIADVQTDKTCSWNDLSNVDELSSWLWSSWNTSHTASWGPVIQRGWISSELHISFWVACIAAVILLVL